MGGGNSGCPGQICSGDVEELSQLLWANPDEIQQILNERFFLHEANTFVPGNLYHIFLVQNIWYKKSTMKFVPFYFGTKNVVQNGIGKTPGLS